MTLQISKGLTVITFDQVDGYTSSRSQGAIVHDILGASAPEITDRPSGLRSGDLTIRFFARTRGDATAESDAHAAEIALAGGGVWTYTDTDRPSQGMSFVVTDGLSLSLDDRHRRNWELSIPFQEIE